MELTLESLGLTREELQERVIDTICTRMLGAELEFCGEDGNTEATFQSSKLADALRKTIRRKIDEGIAQLAERYVIPNAAALIERVSLGQTNLYGEKIGETVPFKEYLVKRAEAYMTEKVDWNGKAKSDHYSASDFRPAGTRVAHMIHEYLHHHIKTAMEEALQTANNAIAKGIEETVKLKLAEILESIKCKVEIKGR